MFVGLLAFACLLLWLLALLECHCAGFLVCRHDCLLNYSCICCFVVRLIAYRRSCLHNCSFVCSFVCWFACILLAWCPGCFFNCSFVRCLLACLACLPSWVLAEVLICLLVFLLVRLFAVVSSCWSAHYFVCWFSCLLTCLPSWLLALLVCLPALPTHVSLIAYLHVRHLNTYVLVWLLNELWCLFVLLVCLFSRIFGSISQ